MKQNQPNHQAVISNFITSYRTFSLTHPYLPQAFYHVFGRKLLHHGYTDGNYILSARGKGTYYTKLEGSPLQKLFAKKCVVSEDPEVMIKYLNTVIGKSPSLTSLEERALVFWIFLPFLPASRRSLRSVLLKSFLEQLLPGWSEMSGEMISSVPLQESMGVIYHPGKCHIHQIESVGGYVRDISGIKRKNEKKSLYFRGHPSLDYLVEMQHYGLPTRLLDITENPLVALYFACSSIPDRIGEVIVMQTDASEMKYYRSDTAAVLAALPVFDHSYKEKLFSLCTNGKKEEEDQEYQKLVKVLSDEVKSKNAAFEPRIRKKDILRNVFVTPLRSNRRIIKQEGGFILCGLSQEKDEDRKLQSLRYADEEGKAELFLVSDKGKLLEELDLYSINKASLFPEIDDVAEYIREKYRE